MELILHNLAAAATGLTMVLYSLVIAAILDTLSGIWAAQVSGNLTWKYISEFVKSHVLQKIAPIMLLFLAAVSVGGTDTAAGAALMTLGGGSVAAYLASVVASISSNVSDGQDKTKGLPSSIAPQGGRTLPHTRP
jgi:hypothetical protein